METLRLVTSVFLIIVLIRILIKIGFVVSLWMYAENLHTYNAVKRLMPGSTVILDETHQKAQWWYKIAVFFAGLVVFGRIWAHLSKDRMVEAFKVAHQHSAILKDIEYIAWNDMRNIYKHFDSRPYTMDQLEAMYASLCNIHPLFTWI